MRAAVDTAFVVLLHAAGRDRTEPRADAADRRAVLGDALLRRASDGVAPVQRRPRSEREAHPSAHAPDGTDADLSEAQYQQASERTQDLSLPAARFAGGEAKPGLVRGHHLYTDASRVPLSGGDHGLAYPDVSVVADIEHAGRGLLRRRAERGDLPVRAAGHHEQRSGIAVYVVRLDRPLAPVGHPHIYRRQGPLSGQHLHRTTVADAEIRVRLPACLEDRVTGARGCQAMDGVLQLPPSAQSPWRTTTSGGLLAESRSNATRSTGADQSLKSARSCPRDGEHLNDPVGSKAFP